MPKLKVLCNALADAIQTYIDSASKDGLHPVDCYLCIATQLEGEIYCEPEATVRRAVVAAGAWDEEAATELHLRINAEQDMHDESFSMLVGGNVGRVEWLREQE